MEFSKISRNVLSRPVMGTIFLVIGRAQRAPMHTGRCLTDISRDVGMSKMHRRITCAHALSQRIEERKAEDKTRK